MFFGKAIGACIICLSPCHVGWGEAEVFSGHAWQTELPAAVLHSCTAMSCQWCFIPISLLIWIFIKTSGIHSMPISSCKQTCLLKCAHMCIYVHTPECERCREAQRGTATVFTSSLQWKGTVDKTVGDQLPFEIAACPTGILMTWSFISTYFWAICHPAWNGAISYCRGANGVLLLFLPKVHLPQGFLSPHFKQLKIDCLRHFVTFYHAKYFTIIPLYLNVNSIYSVGITSLFQNSKSQGIGKSFIFPQKFPLIVPSDISAILFQYLIISICLVSQCLAALCSHIQTGTHAYFVLSFQLNELIRAGMRWFSL